MWLRSSVGTYGNILPLFTLPICKVVNTMSDVMIGEL